MAWVALAAALILLPTLRATPVAAQFVAVGEAGTILTSPDATTWTARTSGTAVRLRAVVAKGGVLIAVGEGGVVLASSDSGASWASRTSGVTETLRGVAASSTRFVAVGGQTNSLVRYSDDGITWTGATVPTLGKLRGVAFGNSKFVAVGASGTVVTSPDGVTWTTQDASTSERLDGVVWTGTKFSAISSSGKVFSSTDGVTWTSAQGTPPWWIEGLTWNEGKYVAIGAGGKIATSPDATTWTQQTSGTSNTLHGAAWSNGPVATTVDPVAALANLRPLIVSRVLVAVGESGTVLTSSDGATWTARTSGTTARLRAVAGQIGLLVAVGETGTVILSTNDGISWSARDSGITETLRGVATSTTRFVAVGGRTNGLVRYSDDGTTWVAATLPTVGKLRAVTWGNGKFVAVGATGAVLTSTDGATWTSQNANTSERLDGAFWTGSKYSVLSETGKVLTSTDGVTWDSTQGNPPSWIEGLTWSEGAFIAVGGGGKIKTSADGAAWSFQTSGTTKVLHGVTWSGKFVAQTIDPIATLANLRKITVSGVTASNKVYDRTTTATVSASSAALVGVGSGDTVLLSTALVAGTFDTKTVGTSKTVTISGLTISGANSGDYTLVQPTATADITAVGLTITGLAANGKTYDRTTTATLSGTPTLNGVISGDTVTIDSTNAAAAFASRNALSNQAITVTGYALAGTDAANYTLTSQPTGLTASISAKTITVSGITVSNKTYDGGLTATPNYTSPNFSGVVSGDTVTLVTSGASAAFGTKTVATAKTVTFTGLTLGGSDGANYTLTQPTTTADITAAALTISGITASDKTYDGGLTATLNTGSAALVGKVSGDTVSLTGTPAGAFSSKTVAPGKTVTVTGYSLTGADAGNYTLPTPNASTSASITAKTITVAGLTASNKTYDGGLTATPNYTSPSFSGVVSGDTVTLVTSGASAAFGTKTVATGKTVTFTGLTLGGSDGANYTLTQPTTTADITAASLTISGITATDKTYDGGDTATLNTASAALVGKVSGDDVSLSGTPSGKFSSKTVAAGKTVTVTGYSLTGADSGNYTLPTPNASTTASIIAKTITVAGLTASNKTYDGGLTATPNYTSPSFSGVVSGDTVTLVTGGASAAFGTKTVANAKTVTFAGLTLGGADGANYTLTQPTTTANITAAGLTISGITSTDKTYDGNDTATLNTASAALVGKVSGDDVSLAGTPSGKFSSKTVAAGKTVTVTGYSLEGADAGNYTLPTPNASTTASITPKTITVAGLTASNKTYDGSLTATPNYTSPAFSGVVSGDTVTLVSSSATATFATKTVASDKTVTFAGLTLGGADGANYTLTQPTTTASITAAGLTISGITATDKTYDGNLTAALSTGSAALVGKVSGDDVSLTGTAVGAFATKTVASGKTVSVTGYSLTGADAGNYTLPTPNATTTASITSKTITVSGITVSNKVYDGNATATPSYGSATLNGVVSGDIVTLGTGSATAAFNSKTVGTGKTVTFTGLAPAGADGSNYTLTQPTTTANITAKTLTVSGVTANNKVYDGSTTATLGFGSASFVGVVSGDTVTVNSSGATGTFANANVGAGKTVQVAGIAASGADGGNYSVTQPTTTANITPASVTIAISNLSFTYDGTPKSATITLSPQAAASIVYSGGGSAPTNAGTYTVSVNVTDNNYSGSSSATLTIAKATQTITFAPPASATVSQPVTLSATSSSTLPVTFSVISGGATLNGTTLTPTAVGPIVVRATQAGTDNVTATTLDRTITGTALPIPVLTIAPIGDHFFNEGSVVVTATVSSGLPLTYSVVSGPAVFGGNRIGFLNTGSVTIRVTQVGDATHPQVSAEQTFQIKASTPPVFFGDLVDDPSISSDRGELVQDSGPRVDAKSGDIAAVVQPGGKGGTVLIVAPTLNLNVSVDFTLAADGTYTAPFTGGGRSLVLTGSYSGGILTGRIAALRVAFNTVAQVPTGSTAAIAGYYASDAVNSANGGTATIVGTNGQILVVSTAGGTTAGAVGTVGTSGTFSLTGSNVAITGSVDAVTTTVTGTVSVASQAAVTFSGLSSATVRTDRLINLSSRVRIAPATGRTLITGFVIGGSESKRVLLRAVGPGLTSFGVTGALTNPKFQLFDSTGKVLLENDDWSGAETSAAFTQTGAFALAAGSKDAALVTTLAPGAYSMQITAGAEAGTALAEIYDASATSNTEPQRLVNISTRGTVDVGSDGLLIGGFVVTGNAPKKVLIRGVGPALAAFGVPGSLADPRLAIYSGSTLVAQNDDWSTPTPVATQQTAATGAELAAAAQSVGAFALTAGTKDSAVLVTLAPGAYTAQVSGAGSQTGVALVEIYELP